jgi:phosphoribosyl-ATP pyrophosphohydrolase/phosphoribosyl-AMP cyclohydrolase
MTPDFSKNTDNLLPAIIQDHQTKTVLMLGYMNDESYKKTLETKRVTFFSRSKNRLWTKGEESGNYLEVIDIKLDCDNDTFLILVNPLGPTCHTGSDTCWNQKNSENFAFISDLEHIIDERKQDINNQNSYVASLFKSGINKIAQKVGEEAVEVIIEAKDSNDHLFLEESADLLFHYLILLQAKNYKLIDVVNVLKKRN